MPSLRPCTRLVCGRSRFSWQWFALEGGGGSGRIFRRRKSKRGNPPKVCGEGRLGTPHSAVWLFAATPQLDVGKLPAPIQWRTLQKVETLPPCPPRPLLCRLCAQPRNLAAVADHLASRCFLSARVGCPCNLRLGSAVFSILGLSFSLLILCWRLSRRLGSPLPTIPPSSPPLDQKNPSSRTAFACFSAFTVQNCQGCGFGPQVASQ